MPIFPQCMFVSLAATFELWRKNLFSAFLLLLALLISRQKLLECAKYLDVACNEEGECQGQWQVKAMWGNS